MKFLKTFTKASIIVFVLWTIDALYVLFSKESGVTFLQWIVIWIVGCFIFVGITQLISSTFKKQKNNKNVKPISDQEKVYLKYQEALDKMGMIFVDFFKEHYFVDTNLLKSESIGEKYRFVLEVKQEKQLEYLLSQRNVIYKNMKQSFSINKMHGKYIEIITGDEELQKNDRNKENVENLFDYMNGHDFEYFCADLLKKNNFCNVEVTQESGDHGVDILAEKDGITYAIQCKCYSKDIGNAAVQQAHTGKSIYRKDIAVVMTNRDFTQQAREEAEALGVKLWNREKLMEFIHHSRK